MHRIPRGNHLGGFVFPELKTCTSCRQELPRNQFNKGKGYRDGLKSWCKSCVSIKERERKALNVEAAREKSRESQAKFRCTEKGKAARRSYESTEHRRDYVRRWKREAYRKSREGQPDRRKKPIPTDKACTQCKVIKPVAEFYLNTRGRPSPECKECRIKNVRKRDEADRTAALSRMRDWYDANKTTEEFKVKRRARYPINDARKRARLRAAPGRGVSRKDWEQRLSWFGHACVYCGTAVESPEMEHVEPLARGGAHEPENVVPACGPCNASKNDRFLLEWALAGFRGCK